ncbi:MAG: corrinoid protein [Methylacidiphilales bacterium]|nr:corrinoid protein [Candidatus Methylacidiphilales bacterium]
MLKIESLKQSVINGKRKETEPLVKELLAEGVNPKTIVEEGLVPAMAVVGERYKNNEIFVPEMLVAARAMKTALAILEPLLVKEGIKPKYKAIIGTVEGDLHDIGKNLVAMMLRGADMDVVDLGVNVPSDKFVEAINQQAPQLVGLSGLLTTTMPAMKNTVEAIRKAVGDRVKIIIGGAPITQQFANEIGADGYSQDAASAVDTALKLMSPA